MVGAIRGTNVDVSSSGGTLPRWALVLGGLALVGLGVYALRETLTPILFAFGIAYLLDPLVDRFEARGIPRAVGIVLLLALVLGGLALVGLLVVPGVVREVVAFAGELPARLERLRIAVEPWLTERGVAIPHSFEELRQLVQPAESADAGSGQIASRAATVLGAVGQWIWGGTSSVLAVISTVLIVPVFAFYLLHDFDPMIAAIRDLIPWRYRELVVDVAGEVDDVLGQFVRGQLLVMLILAVLYSVAYSIVGIRLAIPIGIVAGLLSFIPYVGGATALVLALAMCALGWQGWWQVAAVGIAYGIIQVLEGFLITPRIVGEKVGLAAVWVLVALMAGGELFGFLGVLLAVPAAAVVKIFVVRAVAYYRRSRLFLEGAPEAEPLAVIGGQADDARGGDECEAKAREDRVSRTGAETSCAADERVEHENIAVETGSGARESGSTASVAEPSRADDDAEPEGNGGGAAGEALPGDSSREPRRRRRGRGGKRGGERRGERGREPRRRRGGRRHRAGE